MKRIAKLVSLFLVVLMLAAAVATAASAAEAEPKSTTKATLVYDFSEQRKYEIYSLGTFANPSASTIEWQDWCAKFTATADNANWFLWNLECKNDAAEMLWVKLRYKNLTQGDTFEIWAYDDPHTNVSKEKAHLMLWEIASKPKNSTEDPGWCETILPIDKDALAGGAWEGIMRRIRLDLAVNPTPEKGQEFYLDYFAFFATEEDAKAFSIRDWEAENPALPYGQKFTYTANQPTWIVDFKKANQEAFEKQIPESNGYTLSNFTYDWTDECLKVTNISGADGKNSTVAYTLPNGPVPATLCRYAKIRVKNESTVAGTTIWVSPGENAGATQMNKCFIMDITTEDTDFKEYIIALDDADKVHSTANTPWYSGQIWTVRFDAICGYNPEASNKRTFANKDGSLSYDYFAMFATLEEAQAFDIAKYRAGTAQTAVTGTLLPLSAAPTTEREKLADGSEDEKPSEEESSSVVTPASSDVPTTEETPTTEAPKTTEVAPTTEAPTTEAPTTEAAKESKGGCGSVVSASLALVAVLGCGLTAVVRRKH